MDWSACQCDGEPMKGKQAHGNETRELIVTTAERLFAEQGIAAVSNRQVSEAGGQANNSAVAYHFGTRSELILAVVRRHTVPIEQRREQRLSEIRGSSNLRDFIDCLVRPLTEHIESLGTPSFYARFIAQVTTDPMFRQLVVDETVSSASMKETIEGISRLLPVLPEEVRAERGEMSRHLIVHSCAERERALQEGTVTPRHSWESCAVGLVDALTGLWLAPYTRLGGQPEQTTT